MIVLTIFIIGSLIASLFGVWLISKPYQFVRFHALFIKKMYVEGLGIPPKQLDKNLKFNFFIQTEKKQGCHIL